MDSLLSDLRTSPTPFLMVLSAAGYAILAISPPNALGLSLCGSLSSFTLADLASVVSVRETVRILAAAWLAMVAAMMPLLVVPQMRHAMQSSVTGRCSGAALLFLAGYGLVWMLAGLAMIPLAAVIHVFRFPTLEVFAVAIALMWSASPAGVRMHNACHRLYPVAASGPLANRHCFIHGVRTGFACTAACWPWMLVPFAFPPAWHQFAMAAVATLLFIERLGPTLRPTWHMPYALQLAFRRKRRRLSVRA